MNAGHFGDAVPEVGRLDDIMYLTTHLLFKSRSVVRVVRIPDGQRRVAVFRIGGGIIFS